MRALSCREIAAAGILLFAPTQQSFAQPSPPLLPGEIFARTQNGCGVVGTAELLQQSGYSPAAFSASIADRVWTGGCATGLAEGLGVMRKAAERPSDATLTWEYAYGRMLPEKFYDSKDGGSTYYSMDNGSRSVNIPTVSNPYAPRWVAVGLRTFLTDPDGLGVITEQSSCFIDAKRFPGCDTNNDFRVFGVRTFSRSDLTGKTSWCPNPRTANGCEALWQEKAGPIIARIKAFVLEVETKIAADKAKYAALGVPKTASGNSGSAAPGSPDYQPPRAGGNRH